MHLAPPSQHPIREEARLVDYSLECQDNDMDVKSPINDDNDDGNTYTDHLLCDQHRAPNA